MASVVAAGRRIIAYKLELPGSATSSDSRIQMLVSRGGATTPVGRVQYFNGMMVLML